MRRALFPGTFDPITLGHMDIISRAAKVVDELVIGISTNSEKSPIFSMDERLRLVNAEIKPLQDKGYKIRVTSFDTLLMSYVQQIEAQVIIRGLRGVSDFDYEFQMAGMNHCLNSEVETMFLMAAQQYQFISSRFVKEICRLGGNIAPFVSPAVHKALIAKFG